MLNLFMSQLPGMLKAMGFEPEQLKTQIAECIADVRRMKESQDRCEKMLRDLCDENLGDPQSRAHGLHNQPSQNITVIPAAVIGKDPQAGISQ